MGSHLYKGTTPLQKLGKGTLRCTGEDTDAVSKHKQTSQVDEGRALERGKGAGL